VYKFKVILLSVRLGFEILLSFKMVGLHKGFKVSCRATNSPLGESHIQDFGIMVL
jgi:hypothetical protein